MSITLEKQGKVADIYRINGNDALKIHNRSNRYSIGDRIFPGEVPYKGFILTQMSCNWKKLLANALEFNTDLHSQKASVLLGFGVPKEFAGSAIAVYNCIPIPLECIVRGYYIPESKSWNPYKKDGTMYGNVLPKGLKESEKLPVPIYTPSTKASAGEHDQNITFEETIDVLRDFVKHNITLVNASLDEAALEIAEELKQSSLDAYAFAHTYALERGIILADTKLEFGLMRDEEGTYSLTLVDEVFTPDSSRFWDASYYEVGKPQASIDKQYIRRYVYGQLGWDGISEPPTVPRTVLAELSTVYCNIYHRLFGEDISKLDSEISAEWQAIGKNI